MFLPIKFSNRIYEVKFCIQVSHCEITISLNRNFVAILDSAIRHLGPLAQSVEQQTFNLWVVGSIPTGPT
jgi:hypothetical protein